MSLSVYYRLVQSDSLLLIIQPPAPTICPLENRLHILESKMAKLLKAATAVKSSRDVACSDVTPGVATNGVLPYSKALGGSKPLQQIPDLSGMKAVGQLSKAGESAIDKDEQLPPRLNADGDVNVLGIKTLTTPKATTDRLMFKVDVNYKDRDSVMDSDFWPENVGCREFYFKRKVEQTIVK